jgi:hypothetical protein
MDDHLPALGPARQVTPPGQPGEAPTSPTAVPSSTVGVDADRLAACLMRRYPGCLVWFGNRTRHWWAFAKIRGAWTLLEKQTADEVAHTLMTADNATG